MQWYVLRSKPNKEEALWWEVSARGHEVFYPHVRVKPTNPRSRKVRPYFPGYLFVNADLPLVGLSGFSWLPHAQGLVSFDGEPAEVPEGIVQAIRRRTDEINAAGGEQLVGLKRGDAVTIQGGLFAGYEAVFDSCTSGSERVRVFLKLLAVQRGKQMQLELPAGQIQQTKQC